MIVVKFWQIQQRNLFDAANTTKITRKTTGGSPTTAGVVTTMSERDRDGMLRSWPCPCLGVGQSATSSLFIRFRGKNSRQIMQEDPRESRPNRLARGGEGRLSGQDRTCIASNKSSMNTCLFWLPFLRLELGNALLTRATRSDDRRRCHQLTGVPVLSVEAFIIPLCFSATRPSFHTAF